MNDVMKLAMERRSRLTAEIDRLKEEVNRLNQFIRMGETLVAQAGRGVAAVPASRDGAADAPEPEMRQG